MTIAIINTKISKVKCKIPVASDLVRKTNYENKILEMERNYFTTSNYNKFTSDKLHARIKQKELVNRSDISNLVKKFDLNIKLATLTTKAELKTVR